VEVGLTILGGDPDALYRLPRTQQAQILGWYCATRLPAGWRQPNASKRNLRRSVSVTEDADSFWFGGA